MKNLHLDFETACSLDLPTVGLHRYIEDKSFQPLCVAWKLDGNPPAVARLDDGSGLPLTLLSLLANPEVQGHAWNAAFEDRILRAHYSMTPARPLSCTMQRGLAYGLPGKLEKAGPALGTQFRKDMAGYRLMRKMSRQPGARWSEAEWDGLLDYCKGDTLAEAEIEGMIPRLSEEEQALSELDRSMNNQGIWLDVSMVKLLARVAEFATRLEGLRAAELTAGAVTSPGTQTGRLLKWLQGEGLQIKDVQRPTIEAALSTAVPAAAAEMLGIRLRTARGSVAKLATMAEMVSTGDRLRGQFQFLGAARTGRWSGRGIQPQNLPRVQPGFSSGLFLNTAFRAARGSNPARLATLDVIAPAPLLDCVSWSLRACLGTGPDGGDHQPMWSYDFSQIEARVLAWLAGQDDVLEVFRSGEDVYVWAAKQFGSDNRQLGKVLILALGFGMGAAKLKDTAWKDYNVKLTAEEAEKFKSEWRKRNPEIVKFWDAIGHAARGAIIWPGRVFTVEPSAITLKASVRTLQMRLPSGRVLYYHKPHVGRGGEITYWGEEKGQWVQRRTWGGTLAENATQATARDIMAEAMSRVAVRLNVAPLMTVHDELVYVAAETKTLENLLREAPSWAGGLPIDGSAKTMSRYGVVVKQ